jgi:hypothetical protein
MNSYRLEFLGKAPVPMDDPRQQKAEALLKEVVKGALQGHPELAKLPALQLIVLANKTGAPDASLNASAWDGERCYRVSMKASDGGEVNGAPATLILNPANASIDRKWTRCDEAAAVQASDLPSLRDWLQFHLPDCRIDVAGAAMKTQGCNLPVAQGDVLALPHMLNWISVDTGLLAKFSDDEVKGVLAHEVSHYFLAHGVQPTRLYNYFFKQDQTRLQKPEADPASNDIGRRLKEANKALRPDRPLTGARYHPLVLAMAGESYLGLNFGKEGFCESRWFKDMSCTRECDALQELGEDRAYFDLLDAIKSFDGSYAASAYLKAEKVATACFASLQFKDLEAQKGFLKALNGEQQVLSLPIVEDRLLANLDAYFQDIRPLFTNLIQKHNEGPATLIQSEAIDQDLGYYTRELEADELGLEIFRRMGADPQVMIDAFLKLAEDDEAIGILPAYGEVTGKQCRRLAQDQWMVRPPIARFMDDHLSPCYRAFNIAAELRRHAGVQP